MIPTVHNSAAGVMSENQRQEVGSAPTVWLSIAHKHLVIPFNLCEFSFVLKVHVKRCKGVIVSRAHLPSIGEGNSALQGSNVSVREYTAATLWHVHEIQPHSSLRCFVQKMQRLCTNLQQTYVQL